MGINYAVYAEAKIKDKWINLNPYIVDLGGNVKIVPIAGWEKSTMYEAYEELRDNAWYQGYPTDMSKELYAHLKIDDEVNWCGKTTTIREYGYSMTYTVKYSETIKKRLIKNKRTKYQGYVDKSIKASYEIGEIHEIYEWLDDEQYRELSDIEKIKYSYYEWDDDLSWYPAFKKIERHVDSMIYWFAQNGHAQGYDWDDVYISISDIRLIVIAE